MKILVKIRSVAIVIGHLTVNCHGIRMRIDAQVVVMQDIMIMNVTMQTHHGSTSLVATIDPATREERIRQSLVIRVFPFVM